MYVRTRFRRTDEKSRTTRVTKTRITGGRARKTPPPHRQEGRKGPDYQKKDHSNRDNVRAARMRCARTACVLIVGSSACARARGAAEPCLKFGNAIRKDRAVLHRERPKIIGRGIVQLPPTGCEAECPSICKFSSTNNIRSSRIESAPSLRGGRRATKQSRILSHRLVDRFAPLAMTKP